MDLESYSASETLKDGTAVTVRAIRPSDRASIRAEFGKLDPESIYTRFFSYKKGLTDTELNEATNVDFAHAVALVVTIGAGDTERMIGGGRYVVEEGSARSAELAFLTSDDFHGRGIASLVLRHLAKIGRLAGIQRFEAEVLARNQAMLAVFRASGLPMTIRSEGTAVHVVLALD